jgi:hypothetical protein
MSRGGYTAFRDAYGRALVRYFITLEVRPGPPSSTVLSHRIASYRTANNRRMAKERRSGSRPMPIISWCFAEGSGFFDLDAPVAVRASALPRRGWQIDGNNGGKTPRTESGNLERPVLRRRLAVRFPFEDTPMTRANRGPRVLILQVKFYDPFLLSPAS